MWELDGGEWSASRPGRFIPGESIPIAFEQEVVWVPETVRRFWERKKLVVLAEN